MLPLPPHDMIMRRMVKPLERRKENLIILPNHPLIDSLLKHLTFFSVDIIEKRRILVRDERNLMVPPLKCLYILSAEQIESTQGNKCFNLDVEPTLFAWRRLTRTLSAYALTLSSNMSALHSVSEDRLSATQICDRRNLLCFRQVARRP